ncbi:hypothetical protein BDR04DRAFT_1122491 [Suillus decipiens]|nr:hypothetical protein BDR04DRAFT_1122491 [Suillus decipiens]
MSMNTVLRKSLIGEPLNTQFYLFSTRSKRGGNVTNLQPLFADNEALTASSEYFSGFSVLFAKTPNNFNLAEFQDHHRQGGISLAEYGYASDSDLDEEEEKESNETVQDNGNFDLCANVSVEQKPQTPSIKDFKTPEVQHGSISSRRVLVTDTAFKTCASSTTKQSSLNEPPPCSPKSMYRLALKIKHDELQTKALAAIRSSLTGHNVLQELSSSLTSSFPAILEVEVESLFQ